MENLFITATRNNYRYQYNGNINTDQLWKLDINALTVIYNNLKSDLEDEGKSVGIFDDEEKPNAVAIELQNKMDIVKYIATVKRDEAKAMQDAIEAKRSKQYIADIIDRKKKGKLEELTVEELEAML